VALTTKENIIKVLSAFNPWWKTGTVNSTFAKSYRRIAYYESIKRLDNAELRRTVVLTGLRRVGKTTVLYQIIDTLLKRGIPPTQIVFVSMDHPILKLSGLSDVLECYHENVYANHDVYYFFDEIQFAQDWDTWLKTIYDMQPTTKTIATGSASPVLMKGSYESGVGRWSVIKVPTLSFYEYCSLVGVATPALDPSIRPTDFAAMSHQERMSTILSLSGVQNHLSRYLQVGGFPEPALAKNDLMAEQNMREDVVDKVLKRDLPSLYKIRNIAELERIFLYLCNVSSDIVSIESIARELSGVSRPTVENYIQYLESANLIYLSYPVEMKGQKILKSSPKIYIADAAIRNAVLMDSEVLSNPIELGKMVETSVFKHLAVFYYKKPPRIGYYRGNKKQNEIDIIVDYPNAEKILVEVKFREQTRVSERDAICELSDEAGACIIVTKRADDCDVQQLRNGKTLLRMPAFAFLYLLGNAERSGLDDPD